MPNIGRWLSEQFAVCVCRRISKKRQANSMVLVADACDSGGCKSLIRDCAAKSTGFAFYRFSSAWHQGVGGSGTVRLARTHCARQ